MGRRCDDWLSTYMEYTDNSEPPTLFRTWCGISTICAVLKRKCYMEWESRIYPNMYVVLVGPSGCRKGTAMRPAFDFLSSMGIKMAAEAITREALIRELKKASDNTIDEETQEMHMHASLTIFSQELTVFLGQNNLQLMSDLTDWFDCRERWTYRTKNKGTDDITGVWVNLIGATTPSILQTALPQDAIGGGLTSRIIFVYGGRKAKLVPAPFKTQVEVELGEKLRDDIDAIHAISGSFKMTKDWLDRYITWYSEQEADPPFKEESFAGYNERRSLHLRKLCMAVCASRTDDMIITLDDFDRALGLLITTEKGMRTVFMGRGRNPYSDIIYKLGAWLQEANNILYQDVIARFHKDIGADEMDRLIQTLCKMKVCKLVSSSLGSALVYIKKEDRS